MAAPSNRSSPKNSLAVASAAAPLQYRRIEVVRSHKTIYVRFDLNDYSIPPDAVGRPLTLAASDTVVRIFDGAVEVARHQRTYDRHQAVLDPAHREALLKVKRKAFHTTPAGPGTTRPGGQNAAGPGFHAGRVRRQADGATAQAAGSVGPGGLAPRHRRSAGAEYTPRLLGRIPASA
jgi:hypothetical protein